MLYYEYLEDLLQQWQQRTASIESGIEGEKEGWGCVASN
jgi:hypothetical protein